MTVYIEPLDSDGQNLARELTGEYIARAEDIFEQAFQAVPVRFDLSGRSAGMYVYRHQQHSIRYNPWIFAKYPEENMATTVPHEVAHYIIHQVHGLGRVRPHGHEWQSLMLAFGAEASVTADFDLEGIPQRREQRFSYSCACRSHELSTRRHRAIQRGSASYECRHCRRTLVAIDQASPGANR